MISISHFLQTAVHLPKRAGRYRKGLARALLLLLVLPFFFWPAAPSGSGSPAFYLATDRSFTAGETPYVNLEAPGHADVEFRVYRVRDPQKFFLKRVRSRIIQQQDPIASGNPLSIFQDAMTAYRQDLVQIARSELNRNHRSQLRRSFGETLGLSGPGSQPGPQRPLATPGLNQEHEFIRSFHVPTNQQNWLYRRVPVPLEGRGDGVFLVEGVYGAHMASTIIVRSGLSFLTKQSDRGTVVFAADSLTGAPNGDAQIDLYQADTGRRIGGGETNSQGIFRHAGAPPANTLVFARKAEQYAVSDPNFFSSSFYGTGGPRVLLYTDRPIYRPGDTVFFKAIARNFQGGDYRPLGGAARVSVTDDEGAVIVSNLNLTIAAGTGTADGRFTLPDSESFRPGSYHLILNSAGRNYSSEFRVDAYRKPRYRVRVSTGQKIYGKNDRVEIQINAGYFYGKALADAETNVRVFRSPRYDYSPVGTADFAAASSYLGQTGGASARELVLDQNGKLNDEGRLEISLKPERVDQDYDYTVLANVTTEDSTITGSARLQVNRSPIFIRVRRDSQVYSPGQAASITAELIPNDSNITGAARAKLTANRPVEARLFRRGFRGISEEGERELIETLRSRTDARGSAKIDFKTPAAGHYLLELTTEAPDGTETESTVSLWSSGREDTIQSAARNLKLTAGKDLYRVGETAEVLVVSPVADAHLFLSLEGSALLHQESVALKGNTLRYRVKITRAMSPNFTFSATLFHGGETYQSEIKVVAPPIEKFLKVSVKPEKAVYRPGDMVALDVVTADASGRGRAAEVSLGVVDAALYQLQSDPTPDLARFFYHPRRNNVATTLSSAYRFFGYSEEKRLQLALLRKDLPAALTAIKGNLQDRRAFKDQTFWDARIKTDARGRARITFRLADNLTEWKVTARAITPDTRVGETTASFVARKDIQIQAGVPPYMLEDREQMIAASVANLTQSKRKIEVSAAVENAKIVGPSQKIVELEAGARVPVYFTLRTAKIDRGRLDGASALKLQLTAKATGSELSDRSTHRIGLRPYGMQRIVSARFAFTGVASDSDAGDSSESVQADEAVLKLPKSFDRARLRVRLIPGSGAAVRQSLAYLADYPHGCVEQTMSRFVPLLAAKRIGFVTPRLGRELPQMVQAGLTRLRQFQRPDGGFGWYSSESESDPMMTAYVYRALSLAKKFDYPMEDRLLNRPRAFLYNALSTGSFSNFQRAYLLFALAEAAPVEASMVDGVAATSYADGQTDYGRVLIALTLALHDRQKEAREIVTKVLENTNLAKDERGFLINDPGAREGYGFWQNDAIELTAHLLQATVRLGFEQKTRRNLAATLLRNRTIDRLNVGITPALLPAASGASGGGWKNSRDTAAAVLALTEYLKAAAIADSQAIDLNLEWNGKALRRLQTTAEQIESGEFLVELPETPVQAGDNVLSVTKSGGPALYLNAFVEFYDRSKSFASQNQGLSIRRSYDLVQVQRDDSGGLSIATSSAKSFRQGDLVMVSLQVQGAGLAREYLQLNDALPPGFSVVNNDAEYYSGERKREYDSRSVYDDRVVFFAGNRNAEKLTVRYFLRANLPGNYRALPAKAAFMYYPEISGGTTDQELNIGKR
ncbi:MAG: MG2 domain-containing protein [bacterium]|nr:MG2 domain-containing protein [bacterium]